MWLLVIVKITAHWCCDDTVYLDHAARFKDQAQCERAAEAITKSGKQAYCEKEKLL